MYLTMAAGGDGVIGPHAEQPGVALPGEGDIGAADERGDAVVLDGVGRGQDLGALDDADQGQHLLLLHGLLERRQRAGVRGLIVHDPEVDLLSVHTAGGIDLLEGQLDRLDLESALCRVSAPVTGGVNPIRISSAAVAMRLPKHCHDHEGKEE